MKTMGMQSENEINKKKGSLSRAIRNLFLVIILIVAVSFCVSVYFITENEKRNYAIQNAYKALMTLSNTITSKLSNYSEISRLIMTDERVMTFLRADTENVDNGIINDARYGIMEILNVKQGVDCVMIIREDMIIAATEPITYEYDTVYMESDEWREDIYNAKGRAVITLNSSGIAQKKDGSKVVTIGRAIYDMYTQKRTGILLMNISMDVFEADLRQLNLNNICIVGDDGQYLAGNKEFFEYYDTDYNSENIIYRNTGKYLISGLKISNVPIILLQASTYGNEAVPYAIIYVMIILLMIFMLETLYVRAFITRNITNPVRQLSASMERNKKQGELKRLEDEMPYSELDMLKNDYNNMIDHVNELIDTLVEKEKTLRKAELRVLQEQIKPHFLYNSLETIGFFALEAGADKVYDSLETLGSFYRNFLSKGDRVITVRREVQIVKDYLALQKLRYGDILEDIYDISEDTMDFPVPKLILQPLVENSIYHGIRLKGEKGTIKISSHLENTGVIRLSVRDTGIGMSREQISRVINLSQKDIGENGESSFGLWGTIERVRIYCGDNNVVNIDSNQGEYTEIIFFIKDMRNEITTEG